MSPNPFLLVVIMLASVTSDNMLSSFLNEYIHILFELRWMILLGIILVVSDLWFGISEARMKQQPLRYSTAGRKTLNKLIDYFLYITLGSILGKAIGEPYGLDPTIISISVMVLCYAFEIDSIYGHICSLHGVEKHHSIWRLIGMIFTFKFKAFGDQVKDMSNQSKEHKSTQQ